MPFKCPAQEELELLLDDLARSFRRDAVCARDAAVRDRLVRTIAERAVTVRHAAGRRALRRASRYRPIILADVSLDDIRRYEGLLAVALAA